MDSEFKKLELPCHRWAARALAVQRVLELNGKIIQLPKNYHQITLHDDGWKTDKYDPRLEIIIRRGCCGFCDFFWQPLAFQKLKEPGFFLPGIVHVAQNPTPTHWQAPPLPTPFPVYPSLLQKPLATPVVVDPERPPLAHLRSWGQSVFPTATPDK